MKIALLQYPIEWADKASNLQATRERLAAISGRAEVAVLPEMFTTGFCTDHPQLAETNAEQTVACLREWAAEYDLALIGSFMAKDVDENGQERRFNRGFFVRPDGQCDFVDKRHLYAHGGEAEFFSAGNLRTVSEYKGVRFRVLVCYDLRFPVWSRNRHGDDYDVLVYVANWPDIRVGAWDVLLRARGAENQSYVVGVNRVGDDGIGLHYCGHSVALNTRLEDIAHFAHDEEGTKIVDLNVGKLHHFREVLPLWKDTDAFTIDE